MLKVETPPEILYRVTQPHLIKLDELGNFLPHRRNTMDIYGKTVPLVHPDELDKVVNFFYNDFWNPEIYHKFILLSFWGNKLENLVKHSPLGTLKKHGEHFAIANINALRSADVYLIHGQRNPHHTNAEFTYTFSGESHSRELLLEEANK